jgi:uncharacterized protein YijF (DUF1287 family)
MHRRAFLVSSLAALACPIQRASASRHEWVSAAPSSGQLLAEAARRQLGVPTGYDPSYTRIPYPGGDVSRTTGVCADVIIRAAREALHLDLQQLVHDDMTRNFAAYPRTWSMPHPDANIDHRRVLNLEVFWRRHNAQLWSAAATGLGRVPGNAFPGPLEVGDILTWLLGGRLPHVGIVVSTGLLGARIVHNIGGGVQENALFALRDQNAKAHFRWPAT